MLVISHFVTHQNASHSIYFDRVMGKVPLVPNRMLGWQYFHNLSDVGPHKLPPRCLHVSEPAIMTKASLKLQPWLEARRRFKLSHAQVQMARELGMNPKKLGSLSNEKQQPWKAPLLDFIEHCYFKRFNRSEPVQVRSLEELIEADEIKRRLKQERKASEIAAQSDEGGSANASRNVHRV